ncbi:MAG: M6 family metalloprotease domain-containing protein [Gemmataceae bacterium]|nr:M6 family metalloprotease domain-containing protein [Gemmataceae bacterium]
MTRAHRFCFGLAAIVVFGWNVRAAEPDLSAYRTVERAVTARLARTGTTPTSRSGLLGVHVAPNPQGQLTIVEVAADSPAAQAGVQRGDLLLALDGKDVKDEDTFHDTLRAKSAGHAVQLILARQGQPLGVQATLEPLSRPMPPGRPRAVLGVQVATVKEGEGVTIAQVAADSPAERAKLKVGEIILKINDVSVSGPDQLRAILADRKPDDLVTLTLLLAEKSVELKVRLGSEATGDRRPQGFDRRGGYWNKPVFRLGIICIEYPDAKHNPKIPAQAWAEAMFSQGTYTKTSATGQTVYGSLYDYYFEQSYGALRVEGKAFDYVEVSQKRGEYATGNRSALLTEVLDKLLARDGKDALKDFDGLFFLYAGERYPAARGSLYWPHRSSVTHHGKRWPYFICPEGGSRMGTISVFCHEFGHLLGLPDLYARPENPGMEGVGVWCAMANQVGNGRPQHFCAWSKEKLGWIKPTLIDPTVKQKLILSPIEDAPKECFKVLVRPDGSEYLLLENRRKKGFDESLPAEGLLIWRVVGNRPILQEAHGVEGPAGPRAFVTAVPYPSAANDAFTPYTMPSSRAQLGGGLPVYITNICRLADGRITFHIGYEYH